MFLRTLGVLGLGIVGASAIPRKADALVLGGAPSTSVIGVKDSTNARVNPATEDTLATIKTDTASIASSASSIAASTANIPVRGQAVMANSMPVVIASDQGPIPIAGSMSFDASSKMTVDAADSLYFLRKIVKQLEPLNTVDSANRQRVIIDGSVSLTVTLSSNAVTTVAGQGLQMYQDVARNTYANGVRTNLAFS